MTTDQVLVHGWVNQPDGRGTFDILQSCLLTILLCSWSTLFLNVLSEDERPIALFTNKMRWMVFAIIFPEMLTGVAAEQWRSACQSVEDFSRLKERWESTSELYQPCDYLTSVSHNLARLEDSPWTMRHAFFADMGGLLLHCPDFRPFPIDAQQLFYMIENHYLEYPNINERTIWDRNKADGFTRALTLIQIVWFLVGCLGRSLQDLSLTTLELSTLAFIFCTVNTFFFWRHKPLDVVTPIVLPCSTSIEDIVAKAGHGPLGKYSETPLEFVKPPVSRTSLVAPFWFGVKVVLDWRAKSDDLPITAFGNSRTTPPRGITVGDIVFAIIFTLAYFGIHLIAWNFAFPSRTEQVLWRITSLILLGLLVFYLIAVIIGTLAAGWVARTFFGNHEENTILGVASLLSRRTAILMHSPVILIYTVARAYVIVEGFFSLRALPPDAFTSTDFAKMFGET